MNNEMDASHEPAKSGSSAAPLSIAEANKLLHDHLRARRRNDTGHVLSFVGLLMLVGVIAGRSLIGLQSEVLPIVTTAVIMISVVASAVMAGTARRARIKWMTNENKATASIIVHWVDFVEDASRGFMARGDAEEKGKSPLRHVLGNLVDQGIWDLDDVADFRTILAVRDSIVHEREIPSTAESLRLMEENNASALMEKIAGALQVDARDSSQESGQSSSEKEHK